MIIIRIWISSRSRGEITGKDYGHVSIEVTHPKEYISLWPKRPISGSGEEKIAKGSGFFKPVPHKLFSVDEDDIAEGRPAEVKVHLHSLSGDLLLEEWAKIKEKLKKEGWVLIGANRLINQGKGESCASLAYRLLEAAGIYDRLLSYHQYSSTFSSIVTPDNLATAVIEAKRIELERSPSTKELICSGKTLPGEKISGLPSKSRCILL